MNLFYEPKNIQKIHQENLLFLNGILSKINSADVFKINFQNVITNFFQTQKPIFLSPLIPFIGFDNSYKKIIPLFSGWNLFCLAAKYFDSAEDEPLDQAENINMGSAFLFLANLSVMDLITSGFDKTNVLEIYQRMQHAGLTACAGQTLDLSIKEPKQIPTPDEWLIMAELKSGAIFSWGTWASAALAQENSLISETFSQIGMHLGVFVQILDDFYDTWETKQIESTHFYKALPIVYANFHHPQRTQELLNSLLTSKTHYEKDMGNLKDFLNSIHTAKFIYAACHEQRLKIVKLLAQLDPAAINLNLCTDFLDQLLPTSI